MGGRGGWLRYGSGRAVRILFLSFASIGVVGLGIAATQLNMAWAESFQAGPIAVTECQPADHPPTVSIGEREFTPHADERFAGNSAQFTGVHQRGFGNDYPLAYRRGEAGWS